MNNRLKKIILTEKVVWFVRYSGTVKIYVRNDKNLNRTIRLYYKYGKKSELLTAFGSPILTMEF